MVAAWLELWLVTWAYGRVPSLCRDPEKVQESSHIIGQNHCMLCCKCTSDLRMEGIIKCRCNIVWVFAPQMKRFAILRINVLSIVHHTKDGDCVRSSQNG